MSTVSPPSVLGASSGRPSVTASEVDAIFSKVTWRIVPLLFTAYLFAFLDRIKVGYAQLRVKDALGFSDSVYGFGAGLFFISYLLFEIPSTIILERISVWLSILRVMLLCGIALASTMVITTPVQFYVVRFLLGVFGAGFFPGVIFYLTCWYLSSRRGRVTGQFMVAIPVAGITGGLVSGYIVSSLNGSVGLQGWQWLFLLEGLPTALLGVVCYVLLPNTPRDASWLSVGERAVVESVLTLDQPMKAGHGHVGTELKRAFGDPRVWALAFVYFTTAYANYTFTFWLPTVIKGLGVSDLAQAGMYSALPYMAVVAGILLICRSSDRLKERRWHIAGALIVVAVGLGVTTVTSHLLVITLALLCFVVFFQFGAGILYWAMPPTYLDRDTAAVGIAVVSSIGVIGGFVSPTVFGLIETYTGSLDNGIYFISALMIAGGVVVLAALPSSAVKVVVEVPDQGRAA